jgi:hypothetical protein
MLGGRVDVVAVDVEGLLDVVCRCRVDGLAEDPEFLIRDVIVPPRRRRISSLSASTIATIVKHRQPFYYSAVVG